MVCWGSGAAVPTAGGNGDSWKLPLLKSIISPSELGNSYIKLGLGTGLGAEGALQLIAAFPPLEEILFCRHPLVSGSQAWKHSVSIWPLEQGSSYLVLKAKLFSCCIWAAHSFNEQRLVWVLWQWQLPPSTNTGFGTREPIQQAFHF